MRRFILDFFILKLLLLLFLFRFAAYGCFYSYFSFVTFKKNDNDGGIGGGRVVNKIEEKRLFLYIFYNYVFFFSMIFFKSFK